MAAGGFPGALGRRGDSLPPASFLCRMRELARQRRGGGRGGGCPRGPGPGRPGPSQRQFLLRQQRRRGRCRLGSAGLRAGSPGTCSALFLGSAAAEGRRRRGRARRGLGASGRSRDTVPRGGAAWRARPRPASGRSWRITRPQGLPATATAARAAAARRMPRPHGRQARGQPPQPPSHAGSGHRGCW